VFTTDMSVQTNLALYPWPFEVADPVPVTTPSAAAALASTSVVGDGSLAAALGSTSFAVSLSTETTMEPPGALLPAAATPLATPQLSVTSQEQEIARAEALAAVSLSSATAIADDRDESSSELADSIFDDELFDPTSELEELLAIL